MSKITNNIPVEHLLSKQFGLWEVQRQSSEKDKETELSEEPWQIGYITISRLLGSGGGKKILRLSVQERRIRAKMASILMRICLISHSLNCIAVDQR